MEKLNNPDFKPLDFDEFKAKPGSNAFTIAPTKWVLLTNAIGIKSKAGEQVAGLKGNRHKPDGEIIYGNYKGVRVGIIRTNGKIATVFPDSNQSSVCNKRR